MSPTLSPEHPTGDAPYFASISASLYTKDEGGSNKVIIEAKGGQIRLEIDTEDTLAKTHLNIADTVRNGVFYYEGVLMHDLEPTEANPVRSRPVQVSYKMEWEVTVIKTDPVSGAISQSSTVTDKDPGNAEAKFKISVSLPGGGTHGQFETTDSDLMKAISPLVGFSGSGTLIRSCVQE